MVRVPLGFLPDLMRRLNIRDKGFAQFYKALDDLTRRKGHRKAMQQKTNFRIEGREPICFEANGETLAAIAQACNLSGLRTIQRRIENGLRIGALRELSRNSKSIKKGSCPRPPRLLFLHPTTLHSKIILNVGDYGFLALTDRYYREQLF